MLGLLFWMGLLSTCVSAVGQAGRDLAFLNVGLGARASGMGTAYTALATDSHAAYWNPAGMMFAKAFQMSTMQAKLASDLDVYYMSGVFHDAVPTGNRYQKKKEGSSHDVSQAWGVYWVNGSLGDIPLVTANAEGVTSNTDVKPSDYFSYQAHALGVSYAGWAMPNLAYGLNLTGIYQAFDKVNDGKGFGVSVTPGLLWMPGPGLSLGAVIRDLWSYQKWETGRVELMLPELRLGVGWVLATSWIVAVEGRQKADARYSPTLHAGLEYMGFNFLRLRVGFDEDRIAAGCGVYAGPIEVQYAYVGDMSDGIGDSHRIGFGVSF